MRIHRRTDPSLDDLARWLNPNVVAGWMNYYGRSHRSAMKPPKAPGVGAIGVVLAQVLLEVTLQGGDLRRQRTRERRSPALLEDRLLDALAHPFEFARAALMRR